MMPVILDLLGTEIMPEERELLQHPAVGGVILFTRNYASVPQIKQLCEAIRHSRPTPLLIAVDQEGGRVQRFQEGFTRLPPMGELGKLYDISPEKALKTAENTAEVMATELRKVGVDISFAPVLDLDKGINSAIGDRAFHHDPKTVAELAAAFIRGMRRGGMRATGKHFPGHGSVEMDSHKGMPIDPRTREEIFSKDIKPFRELIAEGIGGMMPAHILFPEIDNCPVGFSVRWLKDILRKELRFSGTIFSDDLNMEGASFAGDYASRAYAALDAGCDKILICNNRTAAIQILDRLPKTI